MLEWNEYGMYVWQSRGYSKYPIVGYGKSIELPNGIVIDVDKAGSAMGLEILRASEIFCGDVKEVIETVKTV